MTHHRSHVTGMNLLQREKAVRKESRTVGTIQLMMTQKAGTRPGRLQKDSRNRATGLRTTALR